MLVAAVRAHGEFATDRFLTWALLVGIVALWLGAVFLRAVHRQEFSGTPASAGRR
jgi:hypothetical protein